MKLIITGATGFVASEVIRQSMRMPEITSVVALARRRIPVPEIKGENIDTEKFKSVVVQDYGTYTDEVKRELAGAGACIWYACPLPLPPFRIMA